MELQQLLKECKTGSITAQKYLYDKYAAPLFLVCRRYTKTNEEAEEVLMNGFLNIFKGIAQFSYVNDIATLAWMKKIMVNESLMHIRKSNSFLSIASDVAVESETNEDVISNLSAAEIFKLIVQLPIGYRTVFNLYVVEGMNHKEIAAALSISEGTSKSQLSKAKQMLRELITANNNYYEGRKIK
jgi:RNA polymerase sigma factor (sigma-70 family)